MVEIIEALRRKVKLEWEREQRPDLTMVGVREGDLIATLEWMKSETGYVQLTLLSVVDWLEDGQFELSYIVTNPEAHSTLIVGAMIGRESAEAPTVSHLWPQAVTYEQELCEMYGIRFAGSPRQGVDFILEGWRDLPPMRRDFDTVKYSHEHYEDRAGRKRIDTREFVGKRFDEKGYSNE